MGNQRFRAKQSTQQHQSYSEESLTTKPVAVYYRQSTTAQVGNISTTIQTVDMVAELERRGWQRDHILLIDDDEGVSGTKRIDEREGMTYLFELISEQKIGAVACQDEDRLFRDMTQIQVNIFIDTCRKADVKVITPYFTYDFAHPLHGEFHARQFRFKCDMAAEYLKSYVLGRLAPARQRLLREGKWAGAKMPVGYMVDMRKRLPDGSENPQWRKFVPFEPYAQVVREYFRLFIENGGAIRKTMIQIRERGLSFPNCTPPEGFKVSYQLKNRGNGYYVNRGNFILLLTNPAYLGHWSYKGMVILWNNHTPIVDPTLFMQAFNALSRYTLTGEDNPDYQPAYQYIPPKRNVQRPAERPLLLGLLGTYLDDKWYRTGCKWDKRNACYLYAQHRVIVEGNEIVWIRRSAWIDQEIVRQFRQKLQATFNSELWLETLREDEQIAERERKIKKLQLTSVIEEMQNLVVSLGKLTNPYLVAEVEGRYEQLEREKERLSSELASSEHQQHKHLTTKQAFTLFKQVATEWDSFSYDERRNILAMCIRKIEATDYNRAGDLRLIVTWRDGSSNEILFWHKPHGNHWTIENVEKLLALFDEGANQLEIAAAFPDLQWCQIFNEIKKHRGLIRFTPTWLGKQETYKDYVASGGRKGKASGSYWREEELATLRAMVERQATQLEIMQTFPFRRWIQLKSRIKDLFGRGVRVPLSGINQRLTYIEYEQQQKNDQDGFNSEIANANFLRQRARAPGFL
jgi:hypothetical protein